MSLIRKWDKSKPPRGKFTLNRDCWRAQNLVAWYPCGHPSSALFLPDMAGRNHLAGTSVFMAPGTPWGEQELSYDGISSRVNATIAPITAAPFSVSAWAQPASIAANYAILTIGQFSAAVNRWQFDNNLGAVRFIAGAAGIGTASKSGVVAARRHHMLGVETSSTSRFAALDGVAGTTDTTASTPSSPDTLVIGSIASNSAYTVPWNGRIGEVCIWNKAWNNSTDAAALADRGSRYELWYPLRSSKWFLDAAVTSTFMAGRAYQNTKVIGMGMP